MENKHVFYDGNYEWIQVDQQDAKSVMALQKQYHLSDEMLTYSLDKNERARVEYDAEEEALLLVFNVPQQEKRDNHFETSPMTFILKKKQIFTFASHDTRYVIPMMERLILQKPQQTPLHFLFQSLFLISGTFFPLVEEVNSNRIRLNQRLREKTTNKNLLQMSDLEVGLVFLVSATKQNAVLLEQIKALSIYRLMDDDEREQLDDALIEAKQAVEMTLLAFQILEQLSGTYNNLLNNNLNDTMKFLTVWSLLLTVPSIVTSFFGMNVPLPFTNSIFGWGIALLISLVLSIWMLIALWRRIR